MTLRMERWLRGNRMSTKTTLGLLAALCFPLAFVGCQQKMADQPSYRPLEASSLFADGRSARALVPGTVSQDPLEAGQILFTGRTGERAESDAGLRAQQPVVPVSNQPPSIGPKSLGGNSLENYSTQFPFPITVKQLLRGQERYSIFCAVCHGPTGNGDGIVVQRGYTHPPSYITDDSRGLQRRGIRMSLREVPIGYLFETVSKGYGAMADYSAQVSVHDRWDIVAYIRTLQFSQQTPLDELPAPQQAAARAVLEATP